MVHQRTGMALGLIASCTLFEGVALARCPDEPLTETLCEPSISMLQPSVVGAIYAPSRGHGPLVGGGIEVVWVAWGSNTPGFGPSHGKIRTSIAELRSVGDASRGVLYDVGTMVSLERNPSRRWLVPIVGTGIGGFFPSFGDHTFLASASGGLYVFHHPAFSVDIEGAYSLALAGSGALSGPRSQLTVSFSLW